MNFFLIIYRRPVFFFFITVFFFLLLNSSYNLIQILLGAKHPRTSFFYYPDDMFADFFKTTLNFYNLSDNFKNSTQTLISKYLYFEYYSQYNIALPPFYSFLIGINAKLFKIFNPYAIYLLNIFLFLSIFFLQIKNFIIKKKKIFIIFITTLFSYAILFMINRGHIYSGFLCLILIQILINFYKKKNFYQNFLLVLIAFSAKPTTICFALYIFNYNISFLKKIYLFFLLLILTPFFFIFINEFNFVFLENIWSFYYNFENTFEIFFFQKYYNDYIIGNNGLYFGSSLWGVIKVLLYIFNKFFFIDLNYYFFYLFNFIICSLIFINFTILFFYKKINPVVFSFALVSFYILVSPVSADYHLIIFYGPLLLIFKDYENVNLKKLYIFLIFIIGFIVSPQHYYITEKFMPEKTVLNPLLILLANILILIKANFFRTKL